MESAPEGAGRSARGVAGWFEAVRLRSAAVSLASHLERERVRWFAWLPAALGIGIAAYFAQPTEPALWTTLALPLMAVGLVWASPSGLVRTLAFAGFAASLGFAAAKLKTEWIRAPVLAYEMHRADVRGIVELIEPRPTRGERITLRVTEIKGLRPAETPRRVRIRVMIKRDGLKPGDSVRLRATLRPPSAPALPGGYDFARVAWFQSLGAIGYAIAPADLAAGASAREQSVRQTAGSALERIRQAIAERIRAAVPGETGAIAVSLITGERGGITEETNAAYRDSGLVHILSISGLHMVIMAGSLFVAVRLILAAVPSIALRYATKKWAAAAALAGAFAYLLISGPQIATLRAFLMIAIMFIAVMLDRQALAMRNVALAALMILIVMPESLLDAGFQMSFAAVVSLIAAYEAVRSSAGERDRAGWKHTVAYFLGGIVLSTVVASLAVAPFGAYHFHRSQQYALLANLIAVPICNLVVMPAALLTLVLMPLGLEAIPLAAMAKGIDVMSATAHWVARLPGAVAYVPSVSDASFALMVAGGLWLTLWQARWRYLGLLAIGTGIAIAGSKPRPDILAGRAGELVAVRAADGRLAANGARAGGFELSRWLEADGDARAPRDALRSAAFSCDGAGCTIESKGVRIAVARHPSAWAEDCERADIVISPKPKARGCSRPLMVIDRWALVREGTHALYLEPAPAGGKSRITRIETVADLRGDRPWSARPEGRKAGSRRVPSTAPVPGAGRESGVAGEEP